MSTKHQINEPLEKSSDSRIHSSSQVSPVLDTIVENAMSQRQRRNATSAAQDIVNSLFHETTAPTSTEQLITGDSAENIDLHNATKAPISTEELVTNLLEEEIELLRSDDDADPAPAPRSDDATIENSEPITDKWRIGNYTFTLHSDTRICGMTFSVRKWDLEERHLYLIKRPTLRYRQNEERVSSNVIYEHGYDRSQPILIALGEDSQDYIVDGNWRYSQISRDMSDGKMKIDANATHSELVDGIRIEPPIPALYLGSQPTTRVQRLAISMALNTTAVNMTTPLELGDIILSLGAFIRSNYDDITDMTASDLLQKVPDISRAAMTLQLLHVFIENNTSHRDLFQRWTLENTSGNVSTQDQVDLMNKYEQYKIYVTSAVSFLNCPTTFSYAFGEKSTEVPNSKFECQWTLRLFSEPQFARLSDSRKTFLLLTLLARQKKWGVRSVPYTPMGDVITIMDLTEAILETARGCMNKEVLKKTRAEDVAVENAILLNHCDDTVKGGPYIRSMLFFLTHWKKQSRKFSKAAILKEVERDITGWPHKRTWRSMETRQYTVEEDLLKVIERSMDGGKTRASSTRRKRSRRLQGGNSTKRRKNVDVSNCVLTALDDEDALGNLLDMGERLGVSRAVQNFTKQATNPTATPAQHGLEEAEVMMDTDESPLVPLTKVVELFGKRRMKRKNFQVRSKKTGHRNESRRSESSYESSPDVTDSSQSDVELAVERYSNLTAGDTNKVAEILKEDLEPLTTNLPAVFDASGMWSHYVTQEDLDGITVDYKGFALVDIKVDEPVPEPAANESAVSTRYGDNVMIQCYKRISIEKIRSNGYLYLCGFFNDTASDWIDEYIEHFSSKFRDCAEPENEYWKPVLASLPVDTPGRYQVFNDAHVFSDLAKHSSVLKSKMLLEVKMGMALDYIAKEFNLKMDSLGCHPIVGTEEYNGTTPIYNHEIGRYVNSPRSKKTDFVPFQLIATGKYKTTVQMHRNSHHHSHLPWTNREALASRFKRDVLRLDPYSLLIIRGSMLHNFLPTNETRKWNDNPWFVLRWFACDKDYDEADDKEVKLSSEENGSSEDVSDDDDEALELELEELKIDATKKVRTKSKDDEIERLKKPKTATKGHPTVKKKESVRSKPVPKCKKVTMKKKVIESSSSDYSSLQESSESDDAAGLGEQNKKKHPTTGRKGLSAIRPTTETEKGRKFLKMKEQNNKSSTHNEASASNTKQKRKSNSRK